MRNLLTVLSVFLLASLARPADSDDAKTRYLKEKDNLDAAYRKELTSIQKSYVAALQGERKAAIERNDLDEAQRVVELIKLLSDEWAVPETGRYTPKDLAGKEFLAIWFVNPHILTFNKDGSIADPNRVTENEKYWQLKGGQLSILSSKKQVTSDLNLLPGGLIFEGRHYGKGVDRAIFVERKKK